MTARAERGPQWDIGTQQLALVFSVPLFIIIIHYYLLTVHFRFLVDKYSELYYDPTSLLEAVKKATEDEQVEEPPQPYQHHQPPFQLQHNMSMSSPRHHTPMRERDFGMPNVHPHPIPHMGVGVGGREQSPHRPLVNYQYPSGSPAAKNMNMSMSMRGAPQGPMSFSGNSPVGPPFNSNSPGQFMGESTNSPIRMGSGMGGIGGGMRGGMGSMNNMNTLGGGMGGGMNPGMNPGMGGGIGGGNMGGGMGMGGMPGGMGGNMGMPSGMGMGSINMRGMDMRGMHDGYH